MVATSRVSLRRLQIQLDANNSVETMLPLTEELEESPEESFQVRGCATDVTAVVTL